MTTKQGAVVCIILKTIFCANEKLASTFGLLAPEKLTKKQHQFLFPVIPFPFKVFGGLTVI